MLFIHRQSTVFCNQLAYSVVTLMLTGFRSILLVPRYIISKWWSAPLSSFLLFFLLFNCLSCIMQVTVLTAGSLALSTASLGMLPMCHIKKMLASGWDVYVFRMLRKYPHIPILYMFLPSIHEDWILNSNKRLCSIFGESGNSSYLSLLTYLSKLH